MGCILAELYTGEMYFPTHENIEHLALMQKQCGPFPLWMASQAKKEFQSIFDFPRVEGGRIRIRWPEVAKNRESIYNYEDMKVLSVSI